jgi:hypothetical protein
MPSDLRMILEHIKAFLQNLTRIGMLFDTLMAKNHRLSLFFVFSSNRPNPHTNRIQREFDSNVAITTQEFSHAQNFIQKPRIFQTPSKQLMLLLPAPLHFIGREGLGIRSAPPAHDTNRIQREFLFNDAIASQTRFLASSHPRRKTNLYKQGVLSLRAADSDLLSLRAAEGQSLS